ncbi:hypothetical protein GCM10010280_65530 [Streptomyces pilosus]|uniref:Cobalamin-independent methionine synthase MetE C-terminal/archaeal domain-containing protein n=1 Tax=Streptomyces pilosus TaxID=28893 RepID=A0A918C6R1_9ACTN|nr:hypothetical protein GCM10010280_65530 [Streptomyces pilosus]
MPTSPLVPTPPSPTIRPSRARASAVTEADTRRSPCYAERAAAQRAHLGLPLLPTTTIGSFPQTTELRTARADLRAGRIDTADYEERIKAEIQEVISFQEKTGIDVLVHGEPERNDMVQYFAEQLTGYLATQHGWVQSYGTRYVRPPILAGDISRPEPMTVRWTSYAQSLTEKPVKGMLTGPVTMLAWSFVRDDQPLADTAHQVAPALRKTLPLRTADRAGYLAWATETSRLTMSGVRPDTQIHTHMCAMPSSATSSRPSTTSTPTSSAWRPPAPTCRSPTNSPPTATRARPDRVSTTSTPRASRARRRPRTSCAPV